MKRAPGFSHNRQYVGIEVAGALNKWPPEAGCCAYPHEQNTDVLTAKAIRASYSDFDGRRAGDASPVENRVPESNM
jgi:hypothetical protein